MINSKAIVGPDPGWVGNAMDPQPYYSETNSQNGSYGITKGNPVHLGIYKNENPTVSAERTNLLMRLSKKDPNFAGRIVQLIGLVQASPMFSRALGGGDVLRMAQEQYLKERGF